MSKDRLQCSVQMIENKMFDELFHFRCFLHKFRSNCDRRVMEELRKHYERPTFLPDDSVSSSIDWIFMGGAGPGAGLHVSKIFSR